MDVDVADFNHDGFQDFVICDFNLGRVTLFLGNGDGTFQPGLSTTAPGNPKTLVVSDLNNDGDLGGPRSRQRPRVARQRRRNVQALSDLYFGTTAYSGNGRGLRRRRQSGSRSVLCGNRYRRRRAAGERQWHIRSRSNLQSRALSRRDITTTDFDQDGNLDLAVAGFRRQCGSHHGRGGRWHLRNLRFIHFSSGPNGEMIQTADFNVDGFPDIAVAGGVNVSNRCAEHVAVLINAADWGPAPIGGGRRTDVLSTAGGQDSATTRTVVTQVNVAQIDRPESEQPANARVHTKPIARIIRRCSQRQRPIGGRHGGELEHLTEY